MKLGQWRGKAGISGEGLAWTEAQSGGTWGMFRPQQRNQPRCTWVAHMKELQETRWIKRGGYPALRSDLHSEAIWHPTKARAFYKDWPGGDRWHGTGRGQACKGGYCRSPARRGWAEIRLHMCLFITQSSGDPRATHRAGIHWIVSRWEWMFKR